MALPNTCFVGENFVFLALRQTLFMLIMSYKKLRNFYRICNAMEFCVKYALTIGLLLIRNDFYNGNKKIYLCVERSEYLQYSSRLEKKGASQSYFYSISFGRYDRVWVVLLVLRSGHMAFVNHVIWRKRSVLLLYVGKVCAMEKLPLNCSSYPS